MKPKGPPSMNDYETDEDVRALQRAHEVTSDPKRHAKAKGHAKRKLAEHKKAGAALSVVAAQRGAAKKASKKFNKGKFGDLPYAQ